MRTVSMWGCRRRPRITAVALLPVGLLLSACGVVEVGPQEVDVAGALSHEGDDEVEVRGALYRRRDSPHAVLCQSLESGGGCGEPVLKVVGLENSVGINPEIVNPPAGADAKADWTQANVRLQGFIEDGVLTIPPPGF